MDTFAKTHMKNGTFVNEKAAAIHVSCIMSECIQNTFVDAYLYVENIIIVLILLTG